ncbi:MAG: sulfurtransferase, partial [Bartonella sp.]|nr:sulfurtransferase [Bartonella sp.]
MSDTSRFIVNADWLQKNIGKEGVSIIDGSWYLPAANRDAKKEYEQSHIPGAVFFDHDVICDQKSGLPHTLPDPNQFSQQLGDLGISVHDTIVVYDGVGFFSAPRVWWMLKTMGADNVFVLNGGFDRWKEDGRPTTDEITAVKPVRFVADFHHDKVVFFDEMRSIVDNRSTQIADARGYKRFTGEQAEPRSGMRSGHMPGACSVPATSMSEGGNLKDLTTIKQIFSRAGI